MPSRPGTPEDGPAVAAVFAEARAEMTYLPRIHTTASERAFFTRQLSGHASLLSVKDDRVAAFAIYGRGWLHHLYVRPASQRSGLGSALLRELKSAMPGGFELWTFQPNVGAQRFYERHGFTCVERTDGSANEERVPDVRYRWKPDSG